ncbi:MAG: phosphatase PAP2 family protein [Gemmatirosa sp.]
MRSEATPAPAPPLLVRPAPVARAHAASRLPDARRVLWLVLGAVVAIDAVWLPAAGLRLAPRGLAIELGAVALLLAIAYVYRRTGRSARLARLAESGAQLVTFGAALSVLSYLVARTDAPLVDAALLRADRAHGVDWHAWTPAAHPDPRAARLLVRAYDSLIPQVAATVMLLALWRSATRLLLRLVATGLATIAVSGMLPAIGMRADAAHVPHLLALRADGLGVVDPAHLEGLIAFPSYHAVLAVLVAHALWAVRPLRHVALALNVVMLVATVSVGGHYLVDVLAGCALAIAAVAMIREPATARA